jgi:hypothetical protein
LREEGLTQPEIAKEIGCSQSSVNYTLATYKQKEDVVNLLLIGKLEDRLANWDEAEKVASKRGDHRPTKERLEMAMPKPDRNQPPKTMAVSPLLLRCQGGSRIRGQ